MSLAKLPTRRFVFTGVSIHVRGLAGGSRGQYQSVGTIPLRQVLEPAKLE